MKLRHIISSIAILFVLLCSFEIPGGISFEMRALHRFLLGLKTELQEKIYLQTDRDIYEAGDVIWFRAWQVSAATHVQPGFSRFLYVELVDRQDSVCERVKIPYRDSLFAGYLLLSEKLKPGDYYLRTYSRWMQNLGEDFIFKKKINVVDFPETTTSKPVFPQNSDTKRKAEMDFDVQFFPEGGSLLIGNVQTVAFKAIGTDGLLEDIRLKVYNNRHELVCESKSTHKGMGRFKLPVRQGERYYAQVESAKGRQKKVELPVSEVEGLGLEVRLEDSVLSYRVLCGDSTRLPQQLFLLGHVRGVPLLELCKPIDQLKGEINLISPPEGILQVLLVDTGRIYSQRLCFISNQNIPEFEIATNLKSFRAHEVVKVDMQLKKKDCSALAGSFAVSVQDKGWGIQDSLQDHILSYLLLSSDLKGYIEDPAWYFADDTTGRKGALDVLLLTQGWTRFKVENILWGKFASPAWTLELGQRISGNVRYFWRKKKDKSDIQLIILGSNGIIDELNPDSTGHFVVDGLAFPEGTGFVIQGRNAVGKSSVEVSIEEERFLSPHWGQFHEKSLNQEAVFIGDFSRENEERYLLEEAIVKRRVMPKLQQVMYDYKSDFILDSARIASMEDASLATVLREIPGVEMDIYNKCFLRMGRSIPVIVDHMKIADMQSEFDRLESMQGKDILRVNLLDKVAGLTLFNSDNGVLVITTRPFRSRSDISLNRVTFTPMGYQLSEDFYMPRYDVDSVKLALKDNIDKRKTIYWNPQIQTDVNGCAHFSFFTSDSEGPYDIVIEGMLNDGTVCRKVQKMDFK